MKAELRWIILGGVLLGMTFIICLTVLAMEGKTSEDLSRILNSGLNLLGLLLAGGAYWRAGGAERAGRAAAEQTNGQMDGRMEAALDRALQARGIGGEERA